MTPSEFEHRKRALEEQLRAGIEMLQKSYQIQLRALELVRWSEGTAGDLPDGSPEREPLRRRSDWSEPGVLLSRVERALGQLPDEVTKNDVIRVLGFTPEPGGAAAHAPRRRPAASRSSAASFSKSSRSERRIE